INTVHGAADPALAKSPENISLYDIFLAIEGDAHLFTIDERTNPQCIVGGNIQETLNGFYQQAETAAKAKLARTSLQDVIDTIRVKQAMKDAEKERRN
ncbi:MAG: Rrf2 family transcriptional regulator, partial [Limosilactobacillus sp.]|nr:Rrf2 family transcriptional regulator [Limosilactobacillus sp.]